MIKSIIKKRLAKLSKRGLYLQDRELKETNFEVGQNFKYVLDRQKNTIRIVPTEELTNNMISRRVLKDGDLKPVIDIRDKEALKVFEGCEQLEVVILKEQVIVRGISAEKVVHQAVYQYQDFTKSEGIINELAAGQNFHFHVSDSVTSTFLQRNPKIIYDMPIALRAMSLFSGAGMLDFGMLKGMNEEESTLEIVLAIEKDADAVKTYRHNIGDHILCADIREINPSIYAESEATIGISGTPCQGFSNVNRKARQLDNPNNMLVLKYIEAIKANPHMKVFVWENVPQILTSGGGAFLKEILDELDEFEITYGILNAKDFGDPQDRARAFLIGSKIGRIELPTPSVNKHKTVQEAFEGLSVSVPNQLDYSNPRQDTIERMQYVPQGGNWKDIPVQFRNKRMSEKATHTNVYKRLSYDSPSCSIVNPRKSLILHPALNRILSVRECARLFSLPDTFEFKGALSSKQQQVANGTCVNVVAAVAKQIKKAVCSFNAICKRQHFSLV